MSLFDEMHARRDQILQIAAQCGLRDIRVFGSVARGEETDTSDIDILTNVVETSEPLAFVDFQERLSRMLGRRVDIVFEKGLFPLLRERILHEAKLL